MAKQWLSPSAVLLACTLAGGCTSTIEPEADSSRTSGGNGIGPGDSNSAGPATGGVDQGTTTGSSTTGGLGGTSTEPPGESPITDPDLLAEACAAKNGALDVGLTRVRRLTREQFDNTVADLIGTGGRPANAIAPDEKIGPFYSNAIAPITDLIVEQHQEVAKQLAADAVGRMAEISPCDLSSDSTGTCATQFIQHLGLRAYRRPLESGEVDSYLSLYQLGTKNGGASHGFEL